MTAFAYQARDQQGRFAAGVIEAATRDEAGRKLRAAGKLITSLTPAAAGSGSGDRAPARDESASTDPPGRGRRGVKPLLVINFAHQLAVMLDAGVPIADALRCVADQTEHDGFAEIVEDVCMRVEAGGEFSRALEAHRGVFPRVMVSLVAAAEATGQLGPMLHRVSGYLAKEHAIARKVRGVLTYPLTVTTLALAVCGFLMGFVLPRFAAIYADRGATLPPPTRLLIGLSEFITGYWPFLLGGSVSLAVGVYALLRSGVARETIDRALLRAPLIGPLMISLFVTRACRTMGTLMNAGVPVLDMVRIVRRVTPNAAFEALWDDVAEQLQQGAQLSSALLESPLIPRHAAQMIHAGERSGRNSEVMEHVAGVIERDFDERVQQAGTFIEPALVLVMGGLIGFFAIALLLPIFNIGKVVAG